MDKTKITQTKNTTDSTGATQARTADKNIVEKRKKIEKGAQELDHIPRRLSLAR